MFFNHLYLVDLRRTSDKQQLCQKEEKIDADALSLVDCRFAGLDQNVLAKLAAHFNPNWKPWPPPGQW
jgi:hypothetical protein